VAGKQTPEGSEKPEATVDLPSVRVPIHTYALTLPVTRQALSDSPFLQAWIDSRLRHDVLAALEDAVVNELVTDGAVFSGTANRHVDRIGQAIASMQSEGLRPNVVLLNPLDLFAIMSEVGSDDHYRMPQAWALAQPPALWGAAQVIWSASLTEGTAIVIDTSNSALLFDREMLTVSVGYSGDGFASNVLTFLAELRAGVDVVTPAGVALVGSGSP
jgi:HK97 family phage major capsid protein